MLVANQQEINLGNLKFGVTHHFKYTLTNNYDKPVIIVKLNAGCSSCTKAEVSRPTLNPGESTDINVQYTPGSTGNSLKSLNVFHTVAGEVKPDLTLKFRSFITS